MVSGGHSLAHTTFPNFDFGAKRGESPGCGIVAVRATRHCTGRWAPTGIPTHCTPSKAYLACYSGDGLHHGGQHGTDHAPLQRGCKVRQRLALVARACHSWLVFLRRAYDTLQIQAPATDAAMATLTALGVAYACFGGTALLGTCGSVALYRSVGRSDTEVVSRRRRSCVAAIGKFLAATPAGLSLLTLVSASLHAASFFTAPCDGVTEQDGFGTVGGLVAAAHTVEVCLLLLFCRVVLNSGVARSSHATGSA